MNKQAYRFLLANYDENDCTFFKDVHEDLSFSAALKTVNDGIELIKFLGISFLNLSHIFPMDLNTPRQNGCECLLEMKLVNELKNEDTKNFVERCHFWSTWCAAWCIWGTCV